MGADAWLGVLRHDEPCRRSVPGGRGEIELDAIAVDVRMLVVEQRIRRVRRSKDRLRLLQRDLDHEVLLRCAELDPRARGTRVRPTLLGPAVRALPELERDRSSRRAKTGRGS